MVTQRDHDERSLALHRLVCERIRQDPSYLERARRTLDRWESRASPRADVATTRWRELLWGTTVEDIILAATDPSEEGEQLRQSSPLATLLPPRDRWRFLEEWMEGKRTRGA